MNFDEYSDSYFKLLEEQEKTFKFFAPDRYFFVKYKIDLLKIDTEGHEYFVIKGSTNALTKIKYIYFEHHYDDMLIKGYKYSDIHDFLKKYNFIRIYKSKMFFRKTFEYIYENSKLD